MLSFIGGGRIMSIYERFQVLVNETLSIYNLATFNGTLFTFFALCCLFLLVSKRKEEKRIRNCLVLPSFLLVFLVLNPIILHYALKSVNFGRLPRLFWAFPFEFVIVYCITEAAEFFKEGWKKAVIIVCSLLILFWGAGAEVLQHLSIATNPYKVPDYTIELTDIIKAEEDEPSPMVAAPISVLHWFRQYDTDICTAYPRLGESSFRDAMDTEPVDLDKIGQTYARDFDCDFLVLDNFKESTGSLCDYGYSYVATVDGRYEVYKYIR